jgi:SAM-dependent methyltransferase
MENKKLLNINCPFCGDKLIVYLNLKKAKILSCKNCKNALTYPPPKRPDYENLEFNPNSSIIKNIDDLPKDWKDALLIFIEVIKKHVPSGSNILEIGCGDGLFLHELGKCGYNVLGIEPSKLNSEKAKARGLNVICGYFPNISLEKSSFDLIVLTQVFEHIENINEFIYQLEKFIPNKHLMLTQTNYLGMYPRIFRKRWYAWVPEQHFWHFSPEGLSFILSKLNFECVDLKYSHLVHRHDIFYKFVSINDNWKDQFTMIFKNCNPR